MKSAFDHLNWQPPLHWSRISVIDMHTGGEPLRVFTSGLPVIEGRTVLEKRRYFREHYDYIRTGTMWEPRGHADMYGAVVLPSLDADFDVFFLHNEGYSTMCGHAIIALTTLAIETGMAKREASEPLGDEVEIRFNVPAGRIHARARIAAGKACDVFFRNVPSFVYLRDKSIEISGIGCVRFDVAYGGAFYALVDATQIGIELNTAEANRLIDLGRRIKREVAAQFPIEHPFESDLGFLYGTIFTGPPQRSSHHSRNVCIFAEGEMDRSATGSGVSARAALHHARGELPLNKQITIESIVGSTMSVEPVEKAMFGPYEAIIPEVGGAAFITGRSEFYFDPGDPFSRGFIFR